MKRIGIVNEPLEQEIDRMAQMQERYRLLIGVRRQAHKALDRLLSAPRSAAAYIGRLTQHRLVRQLTAAGAAALRWLAPAGRFARSVGLVPVGLAVAASPTVQRLAGQAVRAAGRLVARCARGVMGAVYGLLSACGLRGDRMATAVRNTVTKATQTVRASVAPIVPRLQVGLAAVGVALDVARPLVRGVLVHRVLARLIPSRLARAGVELLVAPAVVDGRVGRWLRTVLHHVLDSVLEAVRPKTVLVVVDRPAESAPEPAPAFEPAAAAAAGTADASTDTERPAPQNRAARREAQRERSQARRQARTA